MDTKTKLQSEMTIEDVLKTWPSIHTVFLDGKAECIGCFLQRFCTLREAASIYQIPLPVFMKELEKHVRTINHIPRS